MARITDIVEQKKKKSRVSIYLDGVFYCGMDALTVAKHRLEIGDEIDGDTLARVQAESEAATAFEKAVKYATYRMRTKAEIVKYLREKGYLPEIIKITMAKLIEYNFVSDERFCREYVNIYRNSRGVKRIEMELKRLGASESAIAAALEELSDQSEEAYNLAVKYLKTHRAANKYKLKAHLYAKGYQADDISAAVGKLESEGAFDDDEEDEQW